MTSRMMMISTKNCCLNTNFVSFFTGGSTIRAEIDTAGFDLLANMFLQVYEHVYETVDINSSPEVRANATAKVQSFSHSVTRYFKC